MSQFFQRFDLDLEEMIQLGHEELIRLNLPQAARTLRQELEKKGYILLESMNHINGVANSIMVGGDSGMNIKQDFYELTERLGLRYSSGPYYFRREQTS